MTHQVKIFKGLETDLKALEDEINRWIRGTKVNVINIIGNIAPQSVVPAPAGEAKRNLSRPGFAASDVMLIVVYELPPKKTEDA